MKFSFPPGGFEAASPLSLFQDTIERSRRSTMEATYSNDQIFPRVYVSRGLMDGLCEAFEMVPLEQSKLEEWTAHCPLSPDEGYIGPYRVKIIADNRVWCAVIDPR